VHEYSFEAWILPRCAGQLNTMYRVVLTAQVTTRLDGTWRIRWVFTGSGTINLIARTGQTLTTYPVRRTSARTGIFQPATSRKLSSR
jgi:hypothetical protein